MGGAYIRLILNTSKDGGKGRTGVCFHYVALISGTDGAWAS